MKKITFVILVLVSLTPLISEAQDNTNSVNKSEMSNVVCKNYMSSSWQHNWFLQLGAGIDIPFVEDRRDDYHGDRHVTIDYNLGFGHWFSPYLGFKCIGQGGPLKWSIYGIDKANYVSLNLDLMWNMLNSISGMNTNRFFNIIPFAGFGGCITWWNSGDNKSCNYIINKAGDKAVRSWTVPISAGIQFDFRLSRIVNFFIEGRAQFLGDTFNGNIYGNPIDVNTSLIGGFIFNFGGTKFQSANPCDYTSYINQLNNQVNTLRSDLATTASSLAACEAQLPCPKVTERKCPEGTSPMLSAVRFTLNSAKISKTELVNIYNIAEWMKDNPNAKVLIEGYADKDTGTSEYNMQLSKKRATNVYNELLKYGVAKDNLSIDAKGSNIQPYANENNWNRIVLFTLD